jgi:dipeptidyl aminopeptidase/acylaminoacyl peptidase
MTTLKGCQLLLLSILRTAQVNAGGDVSSGDASTLISRIDLSSHAPIHARREITFDDIISLREIHEPKVSPADGRIAFLVRQAFRDCNCYRTAMYVLANRTERSRPKKLLEADSLSNLRWTPDGKMLSYLAPANLGGPKGGAEVWLMNPSTMATRELLCMQGDAKCEPKSTNSNSRGGISKYEWSPDGKKLAFVTVDDDASLDEQYERDGFHYDDLRMMTDSISNRDWTASRATRGL